MLWTVLVLLSTVEFAIQQSLPTSPTYVAGVVEFQPFQSISDPVLQTEANLAEYIRILQLQKSAPADIIIFPESCLNSRTTATYVPEQDEDIIPCTASPDRYENILRHISCMARNLQKYIVINLTEKSNCPDAEQIRFNDTTPCAEYGLNLYNANVVFDRRGAVISKYRKYNLFGEYGITQPKYSTSATFTTDFNVTFGHFICFDLMFHYPALDLVYNGVTDIIFPTMWFSELPFLSAIQIQQSWAYKNNVNFLSSGANGPAVGSTGTGIFAGKYGPLLGLMSPTLQRDIFVATVPKKNFPSAPIPETSGFVQFTPSEMTDLYLKRDHVTDYDTKLIELSQGYATDTLCYSDLCCNFDITFTFRVPGVDELHYYYRMAIFNGIRTFDGVADGWIKTCAIFACTHQWDLATCAQRFSTMDNVVDLVQFDTIEITTTYPSRQDLLVMPNSVDTSILPLPVDQFTYDESDDFLVLGVPYHNITMRLTKPTDKLFSFAIYGRDFWMDDKVVSSATKSSLPIALALMLAVLLIGV